MRIVCWDSTSNLIILTAPSVYTVLPIMYYILLTLAVYVLPIMYYMLLTLAVYVLPIMYYIVLTLAVYVLPIMYYIILTLAVYVLPIMYYILLTLVVYVLPTHPHSLPTRLIFAQLCTLLVVCVFVCVLYIHTTHIGCVCSDSWAASGATDQGKMDPRIDLL